MKKSKEMFLELRQFESLQFEPTFTKKEAQQQGKDLAKLILDGGHVTPEESYSNVVRLKEVINELEKGLKQGLTVTEETSLNGVRFSLSNTGDRLDYEKDVLYKSLKDKLKDREDLLKLAFKSGDVIYDSDGVEVPKVPIKTHSKSVIKVSF